MCVDVCVRVCVCHTWFPSYIWLVYSWFTVDTIAKMLWALDVFNQFPDRWCLPSQRLTGDVFLWVMFLSSAFMFERVFNSHRRRRLTWILQSLIDVTYSLIYKQISVLYLNLNLIAVNMVLFIIKIQSYNLESHTIALPYVIFIITIMKTPKLCLVENSLFQYLYAPRGNNVTLC